ncbi:Uncharacterized protein PECH_002820 [Penicillium ucsense]|uniref:DUF1754-domain-containing protein n=1 Tax=Penicillium ucsense TaxID=2839758 RepID=A0A8J8W3G2_9EURO|nr:Uncharacterized protein PECM_005872 [Penicillium ucsense]KAF7730347.1 Uncharacterized protein PECH_002820 [Penicillium ucsense]
MAPDEYSTGGGGKLKLKGSKVSDDRVDKKKKKKAKREKDLAGEQNRDTRDDSNQDLVLAQGTITGSRSGSRDREGEKGRHGSESGSEGGSGSGSGSGAVVAKTEAERKYEEMRKKRLQERLKKEGIKSHKERVEELNKYLSRLSEHHDMPKIGPG